MIFFLISFFILLDNADLSKSSTLTLDIKYFKKLLNTQKYLYGNTNIYYNLIDKDIGVGLNKIALKKYKI